MSRRSRQQEGGGGGIMGPLGENGPDRDRQGVEGGRVEEGNCDVDGGGASTTTFSDGGKLRLFVGGLHKDIRPEELRERFSSFGVITDAIVIPEKRTYPIPLSSSSLSRSQSSYAGNVSLVPPFSSSSSSSLSAGLATAATSHDHGQGSSAAPTSSLRAPLSLSPSHAQSGESGETVPGRGFGYVELTPKSEASLRQCFSLFNGCKWRGGQLKVEKAKEHYMVRLHREWETAAKLAAEHDAEVKAGAKDETVNEAGAEGTASVAQNKLRSFCFNDPSFSHKLVELKPLKIAWHHCSKKLKVVPAAGGPGTGKHRRSFPRVEALPLDQILEEAAMGGKRRKLEGIEEGGNGGEAHQNDGMINRRRGNAAKGTPIGRGSTKDSDVEARVNKAPIVGLKRQRLDEDAENCDLHGTGQQKQDVNQTRRVTENVATGEDSPEKRDEDGDDELCAQKFQDERRKQLSLLGSMFPNENKFNREETKKPARQTPSGFIPVPRFDPTAAAGQQLVVPVPDPTPISLGPDEDSRQKHSKRAFSLHQRDAEEKTEKHNAVDDARGKRGWSGGEDASNTLEIEGKRARKQVHFKEGGPSRELGGREDYDKEDELDEELGGEGDEMDYDEMSENEDDGLALEGLSSWERALAMAAGTKEVLCSSAGTAQDKKVKIDPQGHGVSVAAKESEKNKLASDKSGKGSELQKQLDSGVVSHLGRDDLTEKKIAVPKGKIKEGKQRTNMLDSDAGDVEEGEQCENSEDSVEGKDTPKATGSESQELPVIDDRADTKTEVQDIKESQKTGQRKEKREEQVTEENRRHTKKAKKGQVDSSKGCREVRMPEDCDDKRKWREVGSDVKGGAILFEDDRGAGKEVVSGVEVDQSSPEGEMCEKGREKKRKVRKGKSHNVANEVWSTEEAGNSDARKVKDELGGGARAGNQELMQEGSKSIVGVDGVMTGHAGIGDDKDKTPKSGEQSVKVVTPTSVVVTSAWKSLVDAEGRASFSLGSILGHQQRGAGNSDQFASPSSVGGAECGRTGSVEQGTEEDKIEKREVEEENQGAGKNIESGGKDKKKKGKGKGRGAAADGKEDKEDRGAKKQSDDEGGKGKEKRGQEEEREGMVMEVEQKVGGGNVTDKGSTVAKTVTVKSSWKALVDADGRASFSLGAILGSKSPAEEPSEGTKYWTPRQQHGSAFITKEGVRSRGSAIGEKHGPNNGSGGKGLQEKLNDQEGERESSLTLDQSPGITNAGACAFMRSPNAEEEWLARKKKLAVDFQKKHKAAVKSSKAVTGKWTGERGFRSLR